MVRVGLRVKIVAGFATILVLLAVVSAIGTVHMVRNGTMVGSFASQNTDVAMAGKIEKHLSDVRFNAASFAYVGTPGMADAARKALDEARMLVQDRRSTIGARRAAEFSDLEAALEEYDTVFRRLVDMKQQLARLQKEHLDPDVKRYMEIAQIFRAAAKDSDDADAVDAANVVVEQGLSARMYAAEMFTRRDTAFGAKAYESIMRVYAGLGALTNVVIEKNIVAPFKEFSNLLADYKNSLQETVTVSDGINTIINTDLVAIDARITRTVAAIVDAASAEASALRDDAVASSASADRQMKALGIGGVLFGLVLALVLGSRISRPIISMTAAMQRLADGDVTVAVPGRGRSDEIGAMAASVQVFKDNALRIAELTRAQDSAKAEAEAERRTAMRTLADAFEGEIRNVVGSVTQASSRLRLTAQALAATAEATTRQTAAVSTATAGATASVETADEAADTLAVSIDEIGRQVQTATEIVGVAVAEAEKTNAVMTALADSAARIGEVVALISRIAAQTNLLALNATIEAARAGESGRGFAVVAAEVKDLATQTARATDEITRQIQGIQCSSGEAVSAIGGIGRIIHRVSSVSASIAAAVEQQAAATRSIAASMSDAAEGTRAVSATIKAVDDAANDTQAGASDIRTAADALSDQADHLGLEVNRFIETFRAA